MMTNKLTEFYDVTSGLKFAARENVCVCVIFGKNTSVKLFFSSLVNINNKEEESGFNLGGNPDNLLSRERSKSAPNVHKIGLPDNEVRGIMCSETIHFNSNSRTF